MSTRRLLVPAKTLSIFASPEIVTEAVAEHLMFWSKMSSAVIALPCRSVAPSEGVLESSAGASACVVEGASSGLHPAIRDAIVVIISVLRTIFMLLILKRWRAEPATLKS